MLKKAPEHTVLAKWLRNHLHEKTASEIRSAIIEANNSGASMPERMGFIHWIIRSLNIDREFIEELLKQTCKSSNATDEDSFNAMMKEIG